MAKQIVNIGSSVNKGDGDPLRTAFDKINDNFNELYAATTLDLDSIGSNMIPTTDGVYALGSASKQWSDLYVKDFLYIGGVRMQADAQGNVTVDGGSLQIKDVQGDIFADDSTKVFDSATQTFTGKFEGELVGTVAADDSTVLIDGVAGTINAGALTGALPAIDGSALTGITSTSLGGQAASYYLDFANFTNTPTTIAGYGITDAYTKTEVDSAITSSVLPSGSTQSIDIVAQDSTVLVDSVNGTLNATTLTGALPAIDGSALTDVAAATSNTTIFTARADVDLLMGEVVYITGISGNTPTIDKAQANAAGTMPAFGIVKADVTANNPVEVITFGSCPGHDAANFAETGITFSLGNTVYVSATEAGKLTNVAPAGESNLIQNIGKIERATPTTNMTIKVGGAGRTNATPAIDEGNIFIGDAQNRSSTMSFATAMSTYGGALTGDVTGSVFGDDSTLLVDGINNKIVGDIDNSAITTTDGGTYKTLSFDSSDVSITVGNLGELEKESVRVVATDNTSIFYGSRQGFTAGGPGAGTNLIYNDDGTYRAGLIRPDVIRNAGKIPKLILDANWTRHETSNTMQTYSGGNSVIDIKADTISLQGSVNANITGDITGSVFGDDSTLLVDGVNGTLNATTLTGALPALDGSALTSVTTAFSNITSTPTTLAGYGITDALSSGGNITLGGDLDVGGNSIVSASNGAINIAPDGSGTIDLSGQVKFAEGMIEKFATTNGATGVTALDCSTGNVHYLTAPAGDITANFTNLNLTAEYATNVTVVIDQGGTEYEITAVQISGVAQTIVWQGNSAPTGTANGVDSFSFTILNDGGTYVVLGQMVAFGGV
jgi:hypothetical protein